MEKRNKKYRNIKKKQEVNEKQKTQIRENTRTHTHTHYKGTQQKMKSTEMRCCPRKRLQASALAGGGTVKEKDAQRIKLKKKMDIMDKEKVVHNR